jgi:hypothetical protein
MKLRDVLCDRDHAIMTASKMSLDHLECLVGKLDVDKSKTRLVIVREDARGRYMHAARAELSSCRKNGLGLD